MLLALLGLDQQTLAIASAAARDPGHRVSIVCDLPAGAIARLEAAGIRGIKPAPWESLMIAGSCDAVVVASAGDVVQEEMRTEQLRKLVQEGVPLLVAHPVLASVLACYEIDMIRRESGGIVLPYLPARFSPTIPRIGERLRDPEKSPVGPIEQIIFERTAKDRSRRAVLAHFARDVDLIRTLTGDVLRVGVLASPNPQSAYANLTVQMSGDNAAVLRWSILPAADTSGGEGSGVLKIVGKKGRLELHPPDDAASPQPTTEAELSDETVQAFDAPAAALERLSQAIELREPATEWTEAIRDIELAEAIPRSLARGRTIEVQHEQPTEEGTFKGLMTSLGCGLLLIGLAAIVVLAILDAVANANHWQRLSAILRPWPWVMCGVFAAFLALQLLLRLTRPDDGPNDEQPRG